MTTLSMLGASALLLVSVLLIAILLKREDGAADRIVAVDALAACAIAGCLLAAAVSGQTVFVDVAIGFALVAFLGTVGWAHALAAGTKGSR
ncbi:MAG: monovalent cation/H+ antiporter complex subunit F [Rhodocyclaceae bacterium]|nr:hypothetical protein [Xanthomonadales bacterium]